MATEKTVLPDKYSLGPHGLGDPEDKTLRKVEIEVMIPKIVREKAHAEKCSKETVEFQKCCKDASMLMVFKCREENTALKNCIGHWFDDEGFRQYCTEEYLKKRSQYRSSGIKQPTKRV